MVNSVSLRCREAAEFGELLHISRVFEPTIDSISSWFSNKNPQNTYLRELFISGYLSLYSDNKVVGEKCMELIRKKKDKFQFDFTKNMLNELMMERERPLRREENVNPVEIDLARILETETPGDSIVVVDLFATWCAPCLRGFVDIDQNKKFWKEKGVKFLFLCMSSKYANYEKIVDQYGSIGEFVFIDEEMRAEVNKQFPSTGYPSYYILKNSTLLNETPYHAVLEIKEAFE